MAVELITPEKQTQCLEHVRRAIRQQDQRAAIDAINWLFGDSPELQTVRRIELAIRRGDRNEALLAVESLFVQEGPLTLDSAISQLGIDEQLIDTLKAEGICQVRQICKYTPIKLQSVAGIGERAVKSIETALDAGGFKLKPYR